MQGRRDLLIVHIMAFQLCPEIFLDLFKTIHYLQMVSWSQDEIQEDRGVSSLCTAQECLSDVLTR